MHLAVSGHEFETVSQFIPTDFPRDSTIGWKWTWKGGWWKCFRKRKKTGKGILLSVENDLASRFPICVLFELDGAFLY